MRLERHARAAHNRADHSAGAVLLRPGIDPLDKQLCEGAAAEDVDLIGGSIETYDTPEGARERAEYLRGFEGVLSAGYVFVVPDGGRWVLRIDKELPPTQAERYHQVMLTQF